MPDNAAALFWIDITTYALARDAQNQLLIWWYYDESETTPNTGGPNPLKIYTTKTIGIDQNVVTTTLDKIRILAGDITEPPTLNEQQASYIALRHTPSDTEITNIEDAAREYAQIAASFQADIAPERSKAFRQRAVEIASYSQRKMQ